MNIEEPKSKRYVEVYSTDNKGATMIIRKFIEENVKWDVKVINVKTYNGEGGL